MDNLSLKIEDLSYRYRSSSCKELTLDQINLRMGNGELIGLLGPSGCGKTTLLRLIAGFEKPLSGRIIINNHVVATSKYLMPPERRGVGMVFQDYALFPHLNAWCNACFGLRRGEDKSRVEWLLELLGLSDLRCRYPHELSGGQRQRLALVRSLAPGNSIVVLDEPFSNLDVDVRLKLRSELANVLKTCSASAILVTHDPEEALAICDRVAVMCEGQLHQCASPCELVYKPATSFVARFVLQRNCLPIKISGGDILTPLGTLINPTDIKYSFSHELILDNHCLQVSKNLEGESTIMGVEFHGNHWLLRIQLGPHKLRVSHPLDNPFKPGDKCDLTFRDNKHGILFPGGIDCSLTN